ncbi:hypothetical protein MJO28_007077 [Puccinia striiformis f. sp. tritici]|uniref:Uncharacterized protein n=1 Tax=Puccinia striiformis f. sp. tritici TaxID=168172 RepID=A0ACC0ECU4_9BASI|nr:hypothetical protein MJO28_007077 [Puccinia striiformis f. sp. tritici]
MATRSERLSITPPTRDPGNSLPSAVSQAKENLPAHLQVRPQLAARSFSANSYVSHAPLAGHSHRLSDIPGLHPALDIAHHPAKINPTGNHASFSSAPLNLNMLAYPPRFHSPIPPPSQGYTNHSHTGNRLSMQPSHSQPAIQSYTSRDQRRETFQSHAPRSSGQFGQATYRQSRHLDIPTRRSYEPANLIQSLRDPPQKSRPNSVQADPRRVVTGVLQSALPPSSRPVPANTTPIQSMSIDQLDYRHKAALQKLQTHSNRHVAQTSTAQTMTSKPSPARSSTAQGSASKPPRAKSSTARSLNAKSPAGYQSENLERHHRHKAAMHKLQAHSTPPVVAASQAQSGPAPQKTVAPSKPTVSGSDTSSKSTKVELPVKQEEKGSGSNSKRRSLFGFFNRDAKCAAGSAEESSNKSKNSKLGKKQNKEATTPVVEKVEEEDEDVPLAQLASRRASHHPSALNKSTGQNGSHLPKSYSVPGMMHTMSSRGSSPESNSHHASERPQHLRSFTNPIDNRPNRQTTRHHDGGFQSISEDTEVLAVGNNRTDRPGQAFQPPRWLDETPKFDPANPQKQGPRPLIFEDEAKAIRNSRRLLT